MPFVKKTRTFDFGPLGAPEFTCTIVNPKSLSKAELDEVAADGGSGVAKLILEWNLTDDQGQPLPLPSADPGVLDRIPVEAVEFLADQIKQGVNVPNG